MGLLRRKATAHCPRVLHQNGLSKAYGPWEQTWWMWANISAWRWRSEQTSSEVGVCSWRKETAYASMYQDAYDGPVPCGWHCSRRPGIRWSRRVSRGRPWGDSMADSMAAALAG